MTAGRWVAHLKSCASCKNEIAIARTAAGERMGIIDADGSLVSRELPPDMLPDSDTTLDMG